MPVRYERRGHVALIVLDRPERGNSFDREALESGLPHAWHQADTDPEVGAVVVTGAGDRFFCTGVDMKDPAMVGARTGTEPSIEVKVTGRQNGVWKPIITAVNGLCVGGAMMFVADSDITIGLTAAAFSNPGVSLGIAANVASAVLARTADFHRLLRMTLLGNRDRLDADAALRAGLIQEIVQPDDLLDVALQLAADIATNSPAAVTDALRTLWGSLELPLSEARAMAEHRAAAFCHHPDALEGQRALVEGRAPSWSAYREAPPEPD